MNLDVAVGMVAATIAASFLMLSGSSGDAVEPVSPTIESVKRAVSEQGHDLELIMRRTKHSRKLVDQIVSKWGVNHGR